MKSRTNHFRRLCSALLSLSVTALLVQAPVYAIGSDDTAADAATDETDEVIEVEMVGFNTEGELTVGGDGPRISFWCYPGSSLADEYSSFIPEWCDENMNPVAPGDFRENTVYYYDMEVTLPEGAVFSEDVSVSNSISDISEISHSYNGVYCLNHEVYTSDDGKSVLKLRICEFVNRINPYTTSVAGEPGESIQYPFSDDYVTEQKYAVKQITVTPEREDISLVKYAEQKYADGNISVWEDGTSALNDKYMEDEECPALDKGYELAVVYWALNFARIPGHHDLEDPDSAIYTFIYEVPVPEGYDGTTAMYYYGDKFIPAESYNSDAGTLTVKKDFSVHSSSWVGYILLAECPLVVEYQKSGAAPPPSNVVYGDIDGDGKISAYDASLILTEYTMQAGKKPSILSDEQKALADIDGDGKISAYDASLVLSFYNYRAGKGTETDIRKWVANLK